MLIKCSGTIGIRDSKCGEKFLGHPRKFNKVLLVANNSRKFIDTVLSNANNKNSNNADKCTTSCPNGGNKASNDIK